MTTNGALGPEEVAAARRERLPDTNDRLTILLASYGANRSDESSWGHLLLAVVAATLTYMAASLVFMSELPAWAVLFLPAVAISFLAYLVELLEVAGVRREELEAIERDLELPCYMSHPGSTGLVPGFMVNTRYIWVWTEANFGHRVLVAFSWLAIMTSTSGYMALILIEAYTRAANLVAMLVALLVYGSVLAVEGWLMFRCFFAAGSMEPSVASEETAGTLDTRVTGSASI